MMRAYEVALLLTMFDGEAFVPSLDVDAIVPRVAALARKTRRLAEDFSVDLDDAAALRRLLVENPIAAFVPRNRPATEGHVAFDGRRFGLSVTVADPTGFGRLLREILDWRLAQYLSRSGDGRLAADVICRVARNGSGSPILFLPTAGAGGASGGPWPRIRDHLSGSGHRPAPSTPHSGCRGRGAGGGPAAAAPVPSRSSGFRP